MGQGWIKLDRALENWRYATKPNYVALWVHLLIRANKQDSVVYDTEIKRGSLLTSLDQLSKATGLSVQNIRTILKHLNGEEITVKSTNKNTVISIVKYDEYQGINKQTNKRSNNQLTNDQQATNNKQEYKNIRIEEIEEDKYKYMRMIDRFKEAGYSDDALLDAISIFQKCEAPVTQSLFGKVLSVLADDSIQNKQGYCYKIFSQEGII